MSLATVIRGRSSYRQGILSGLCGLLVALTGVGAPPALLAQEAPSPDLVQSVPLHSTVEVSGLPRSVPRGSGKKTKPFLMPDPEAIQRWKEHLRQVPGALPPAGRFVQDSAQAGVPSPLAPSVSLGFEGLANSDNITLTGFSVVPPDDNLGVGPSHIFQMVNIVGRTSNKLGGTISSFDLNSFFGVDLFFDESDPRVIYDAVSGRWFATYLQFSELFSESSTILAVSTTSDPTGTFCRYRIGNPTAETFLQDFPMLGVSNDKVVISYNGFTFPLATAAFIGSGYYVLNKADLLATPCTSPRMVRFAPSLARATPHPAQSLGSTSDLFLPMHVAALPSPC